LKGWVSVGPLIAIPIPHSSDADYAQRAIPQYETAVMRAAGEPVRIALGQTADEVRSAIERCDGVLLPGSNADVDPARFQAKRSARTAAADPPRDAVDDLLLENAYAMKKPVLGICYGLQSLNVYRGGSLVQHIPDFLPERTRGLIDHAAGKTIAAAHSVEIISDCRLARVMGSGHANSSSRPLVIPVNSSHHQSADGIGEGLRVVARCPDDGIIEALEGTAPDHFVFAVQWHPERSVEEDAASAAIFRALIDAAELRRRKLTAKAQNG
jgi:putative glutamine amidotransferase